MLQAIIVFNFKENKWIKLVKMAKNLVYGPILAQMWSPKIFLWALPLLDVMHWCKLSLYAISRKTSGSKLRKWQKKPSFGPDFGPFGPNLSRRIFFFKNLAPPVTWYHGRLSSCTIPEKTDDLILRKLTDGRTDGRTDRQTDRRSDRQEWFHRTLSDLHRASKNKELFYCVNFQLYDRQWN